MALKSIGPRAALLLLSVLGACGGGGGGKSSPDEVVVGPPTSDFQLKSAWFARPILGLDGELEQLVNPASVFETDPLTGVPLPGYPQPLDGGQSLDTFATVDFAQLQDPITPQIPLIPRNAALVLGFTKDVDPASLGFETDAGFDDILGESSTIQVRDASGVLQAARGFVQGDRVILLGELGDVLGWDASPLVFDPQGKVIVDPTGHLRISVGHVGAGTLSATDGESIGVRPDLLGSPFEPLPFNPGNSQLDAIVQQTAAGTVHFNGFLPDTSAPRIVRSVSRAGTLDGISSVSSGGLAAVQLTAADLAPTNVLANAGAGEWARALLTITSAGGLTSQYVVARNLDVAGSAVLELEPGQLLDASVVPGDSLELQRTEFFEPIAPPLPLDPAQLAHLTVDPERHPRDPHDPEDLLNSDLRMFVTVLDEQGAERNDVWDPSSGTFGAIPPRSSLELRFSEPMDVDSFRPYESFAVSPSGLQDDDAAFEAMRIGRAVGEQGGRRVRFEPFLEDQYDPSASRFVGFGGTPSGLRLVLRTRPSMTDLAALAASATPDILEQLIDLDVAGVQGITDLGGRGLGLPAAMLDQTDPEHFLLSSSSAGRGAFAPAVDFAVDFATQASDDPDHGVFVHRFMGQAQTAMMNYAEDSVHDEVTEGVEFHDHPPVDSDGDGEIDRRYLYGPRLVEVGLNVPGRLTGAPAHTIEHVVDKFNPPKPSQFASPNGEDLLISVGFGVKAPLNSAHGSRFQHIYRAGDASPSMSEFRGVILDLVGLAWSPEFKDGKIKNTKLDGMEILVGLSGINRGRGPTTQQTNGIPFNDGNTGLIAQFDCNLLEWNEACCNDPLLKVLEPYAADQPTQTTVVTAGTPYSIEQTNVFKPAATGSAAEYFQYLDFPQFNAGVDPTFGNPAVKSFPYDSRFPMLIEYRTLPNDEVPAENGMNFSPGVLTSALPRFRVWSQGQDPLAYGVPNWSRNATGTGPVRAGEGGPLIEPGTSLPIKPPELNNGMPILGDKPGWGLISPPRDKNAAGCPSLQPAPDFTTGSLEPTLLCFTSQPTPNTDPDTNWYFANGMFTRPEPDLLAYPGPTGQPPTPWYGYGGAGASPIPGLQGPCLIPFEQSGPNVPSAGIIEPNYQPSPGRYGDNSRYYMLWKYRKRVSIIESPTLEATGFAVRHLRPLIVPPVAEIQGPHELRVEVRAAPTLDNLIDVVSSGYVDITRADYSDAVTGLSFDRRFAKFRVSMGVADGHVQPPAIDTIVMPYEVLDP